MNSEYKPRQASYKDEIPVYVLAVLLVVSFIIYANYKIPKINSKREAVANARYKDFVENGINKIQINIDNKSFIDAGEYGTAWVRINKVYINDIQTEPDSFYRCKEFIINHCGKFYFLFGNFSSYSEANIVLYSFYPKVRHDLFNLEKEKHIYSYGYVENNKFDMKRLKNKLPKCWD